MELKHSDVAKSPLLLIAPFFLWGTAMVAMKGTLLNTTPLFLAGVRLLPAGLLVLIGAIILKKPQPQTWKAWLWILIFALVDGAMFQGFLAEGLQRTSAGLGSVMIDSQPLAVALLCSWLFGEVIGFFGFLGLAIGILGISLIGLPDELILNFFQVKSIDLTFSFRDLFDNGQWLMLLASLSMAVGTVMIRYVCRYVDPLMATAWHMIIGGIILALLSGGLESQQWVNLTGGDWLALSYATIFGSAIAYGLFFFLASSGNLTSLSSLTFLTPVFAICFGKFFLAEVLSPLQWVGVVLTLVSIYLINQRETLAKQIIFLIAPQTTATPEEVEIVKLTDSK